MQRVPGLTFTPSLDHSLIILYTTWFLDNAGGYKAYCTGLLICSRQAQPWWAFVSLLNTLMSCRAFRVSLLLQEQPGLHAVWGAVHLPWPCSNNASPAPDYVHVTNGELHPSLEKQLAMIASHNWPLCCCFLIYFDPSGPHAEWRKFCFCELLGESEQAPSMLCIVVLPFLAALAASAHHGIAQLHTSPHTCNACDVDCCIDHLQIYLKCMRTLFRFYKAVPSAGSRHQFLTRDTLICFALTPWGE